MDDEHRTTLAEFLERVEHVEERHQQDVDELHEELARLGERFDELENALDTFMGQRVD